MKEKAPNSLELNKLSSGFSGSLSFLLTPSILIRVYSPECSVFVFILQFPGTSTLIIILSSFL